MAVPHPAALSASPLQRVAPALFVLLWSTGFLGAKLGLPYAGPMTFLGVRFAIVAVLAAPLALASGARWPERPAQLLHVAVVGLLMQFAYLGGVFTGIAHGVPAGVSALIVGLQPILTAALAGLVLGERIRPVQWLGLALGLAGVALVVINPALLDRDRLGAAGITIVAMVAITVGTLYQKRFCSGIDLRVTVVIQNAVSALAMLPAALLFEPFTIEWTPRFVFAIAWLAIVLSLGATMLLFYLIRHGAASRVSSLFYLTPAVTAVMAFALFGETLSPLALVGMALAAAGVWAVNSSGRG
ncbi:peptide ABC transporter ATP-binding protein [Aliidongia dinghuensis]|uniref:Peptide ABC transporter ATP-binding protein n=1 Tax=Aliidongia dinghuensis TaxID=1867774 RepID=A0A8J3E7G4_9PROT|nr:DMT family transporter [Aliidongia dinghuensis]GGF40198.1 peptide ABC transporter ATP-binding protein [Aliidongia dinghuensis]